MKKQIAFLAFAALATSCGNGQTPVSSIGGASAEATSEFSSGLDPDYAIPSDDEIAGKDANGAQYELANVETVEDHPLAGKKIYWLGSSVTYGASSGGVSMAEYLGKKAGLTSAKEAVSGTTLFNDGLTGNTGANSYVNRLIHSKNFSRDDQIDAFICQISTNDCTADRLSKRGTMTPEGVEDLDQFDVATTLGAVEYIIEYVLETYFCPVYFYSGAYFGDGNNKAMRQNGNPKGSDYGILVSQVKEIAKKWDAIGGVRVGVIDLYNDKAFNAAASDAYYAWSTSDPIHPKKAGYLQWWMPYFEAYLTEELA